MSGLFTGEDAEKAGGARPVCLIQPPFTQLNTPYPSLYYLKTFLQQRGCQVLVRDHSIGLFERVFCRTGLERIFADAEIALMGNRGQSPGSRQRPEQNPIVERFLSEAGRWIAAIDRLISFLRGKDREWAHFLSLANGVLPGGPRFDACLESLKGSPLPEDAPLLAGKLLADLADFITHTLDPNFSLVRYAGRTGAALRDFTSVKQNLDGYILKNFYRPYLEEEWDHLTGFSNSPGENPAGSPPLIGITIPFPGCLAGALVCGASAKQRFGGKAAVIAGGGYVNTELRFTDDPAVFDYVDYLSFDRGYGSWEAILESINMENDECQKEPALYKTMYRSGAGKIIADPAIADPVSGFAENNSDAARFRWIDDESVKKTFPDYRDADFSRYLYPVDDVNPMHRLWSDGHWLKAYLAHGCYWHACAFCDLGLDYIRSYQPVDTAALFRHLVEQAEQTGVHGVHLVDEAAPVSSLVQLAKLNRDAGLPLTFWGNIRFEKAFTSDIAAILAAGGLVGISAGIEVATPAGFKRLGKGIVLEDVVRSCAAFKEAGILTHAYLIYGYWDQDEQEIVDSAEILRQLFAAELLDSAFWHQFVLTRHSRIYAEWKRGLHPELRVSGDHDGSNNAKPIFALNDLSFEGEEKFNKYTEPLDRLLASWLVQDLAESRPIPVTAVFPFRVKEPSVSADTVAELLDSYARDRDEDRGTPPAQHGANFPLRGEAGKPETAGRVLFLGSRPRISGAGENAELSWRWRLGEHRLRAGSGADRIAVLLCENSTRNSITAVEFYNNLKDCLGEGEAQKAWQTLRERGLAIRIVQ